MIDLERVLTPLLPDDGPPTGSLERTRSAGRLRRNRKRTAFVAVTAIVALIVIAGAVALADRGGEDRPAGVTTGTLDGLGAPTTLTVTCSGNDQIEVSSDVVRVQVDGIHVSYHSTSDGVIVSLRPTSGMGGSGLGLGPGEFRDVVETVAPGDHEISCFGNGQTPTATVTVVDPEQIYGSVELYCPGGGMASVDFAGEHAPVPSAADALTDLLTPDALADHDVQPAGYPREDPRPYVVRQDGDPVALATFRSTAEGLVLVDLSACAGALAHGN